MSIRTHTKSSCHGKRHIEKTKKKSSFSVVKSEQHVIEEEICNGIVSLHVSRVMPVMERAEIDERLVLLPRMTSHVQTHVNVVSHAKHGVRDGPRNKKRAHMPRSAQKRRGKESKHISKLVVDLGRARKFPKETARSQTRNKKQTKNEKSDLRSRIIDNMVLDGVSLEPQ